MLGLINLSLDPWAEAEFEFAAAAPPVALEVLRPDGHWDPLDPSLCNVRNGVAILRWLQPVSLAEPLFLNVKW